MFPRSPDQELFEDTTRKFLEDACPPAKLRALAPSPVGYEPGFWRQGAELGWTSLLVPEDAGGGSVSGHGVVDLALVAYQFGAHAAAGPLLGCNLVAAALGRWGTDEQRAGPLAQLVSGEATGAWVRGDGEPHATSTATGVRLDGATSPVEATSCTAHLLVVARHGDGRSQFLVPADAPGVTVVPLHGVDATRRFARVELAGVDVPQDASVGEPTSADAAVDWLSDLAVTVQLAEMCGAMQWAFDTTLEWARNRYSFGRPLASYQEIKHRFADMKMWLEASLAISARAADAVDRDTPDRSELVSAGKFYVGTYGVELMHDCVQIHGGIGVTTDHDLHLFLRRVVSDAAIFGSAREHAARLTDILEAKDEAG
ncbi:MAG TPA: acyl-CoA dehydrogenase family protein [Acidimicrobiia bacterium]|nr:acyl-CoA dehydrogenase family protein [Acidimicrobiia bacterium]